MSQKPTPRQISITVNPKNEICNEPCVRIAETDLNDSGKEIGFATEMRIDDAMRFMLALQYAIEKAKKLRGDYDS